LGAEDLFGLDRGVGLQPANKKRLTASPFHGNSFFKSYWFCALSIQAHKLTPVDWLLLLIPFFLFYFLFFQNNCFSIGKHINVDPLIS
jgi:hypothetical protein